MDDIHSVRIGSRAHTHIHVEPLIWLWLREIAANRGTPLSQVMDEIDRCYRLNLDSRGNQRIRSLSSAVRVFVTEHIASQAVYAKQNAARSTKRFPPSI
jgi:predicted DNA-binding ribbon-helix-helix protein